VISAWVPPKSPVGMLQEDLWPDEWKILVACLLHNQTSRKQVNKVYQKLFEMYPTPVSMESADVQDLQSLLKPLGMWRKRSATLQRFSREYLEKNWNTPKELFGCGKYAEDTWRVFCMGDWKNVEPNDHALNKYRVWLEENYA
jgi:methyl-CpG-binding domain protein 4